MEHGYWRNDSLGNVPNQKEVGVEGELAPGAYLLVARSPTEGESAEALIL